MAAFSTILIPTDGSGPAKAAAAVGVALAAQCGARVVFANVIDAEVVVDLEELAKQEAETVLGEAQQRAAERNVAAMFRGSSWAGWYPP